MIKLELPVEPRAEKGKNAARRMRKEGFIPAIIYGGNEPVNIKVNKSDFVKKVGKVIAENPLITVSVGKVQKTVIVKEVQKDPIKGEFVHLDFNEISMDKKLHTHVKIVLTGEAKGVSLGGILEFNQRDIDIECLPGDIPEKILVDIANLNVGESVHIRDLSIDEKIKVLTSKDALIVSVVSPKVEPTSEEEGSQEEPEVITKGKKEKAE